MELTQGVAIPTDPFESDRGTIGIFGTAADPAEDPPFGVDGLDETPGADALRGEQPRGRGGRLNEADGAAAREEEPGWSSVGDGKDPSPGWDPSWDPSDPEAPRRGEA